MSTQTKHRRGTSAQCDAMTPAEGEIIVDTSNDRLRVGDGLKAGGFILPNAHDIQSTPFNFATAGGTDNAITLTLALVPTYAQPLHIRFRAVNTNTGTTTIDVNGLGTKNIYKVSAGVLGALVAGDIIAGVIYDLVYDGTQFQMLTVYGAGIVTVSQGDLNTSQGSFSYGTFNNASATLQYGITDITAPGGEYGFAIQIAMSGSVNGFGFWVAGTQLTGFQSNYRAGMNVFSAGSGTRTVYGQQRYINASPPFDLGDGEVGGFVFLLLNESNDVVSHYAADVPPWGYNGPTDIRATHKDAVTGKKYRSADPLTLREAMGSAKPREGLVEITHEMKNRDMAVIPHPFGLIPDGYRVVMLDPMSDMVFRMVDTQNKNGGNDVAEAIHKGHIQLDNAKITRKGPKGVHVSKFKYKRT